MRKTILKWAIFFGALGGCLQTVPAEEPAEKSTARTLWNAFWDELAGKPDARALSERRHFNQAGISFDYPAALHVERDSKGDLWRLGYGDFELEVHESAHAAVSAAALFDGLSEVFGHRAQPGTAAAGDVVEFCGQHVEPVRLQLTLLDDPHEMKGYDLPAPDGEARFLVFDDALENNQPSAVAAATFAAVTATLRCAAQRH